jgi:hypothetical protein
MFGVMVAVETSFFSWWFRRSTITASTIVFLIFLFYSPLAQNAARLVSICQEYPFYEANAYLLSGTGAGVVSTVRLLSADPGQDCDDPSLPSYRAGAWLTIILFNVGAPAALVLAYWRQSAVMRSEVLGFLLQNVRDEMWFWELVVALRKMCVAIILGVLSNHANLQLQLLALVAAMMFAASLVLRPRQTESMNQVEMFSTASALLLAILLATSAAFPDSRDTVVLVAVVGVASQAAAISAICVVGWRQFDQKQEFSARMCALEVAEDEPQIADETCRELKLKLQTLMEDNDELRSRLRRFEGGE